MPTHKVFVVVVHYFRNLFQFKFSSTVIHFIHCVDSAIWLCTFQFVNNFIKHR